MSTFIVSKKLGLKQALEVIPDIEEWFKKNPKRKFCQTETFRVRKGFVGTDVLEHTDINIYT